MVPPLKITHPKPQGYLGRIAIVGMANCLCQGKKYWRFAYNGKGEKEIADSLPAGRSPEFGYKYYGEFERKKIIILTHLTRVDKF
jgi:hypothetical protein